MTFINNSHNPYGGTKQKAFDSQPKLRRTPSQRKLRLQEFDRTYTDKYARYLPKVSLPDAWGSISRTRACLAEQYSQEAIDRVPPRFMPGCSYLAEDYTTTFLRAIREGRYMPKRNSQGYCVLRAIMEEHKRKRLERR